MTKQPELFNTRDDQKQSPADGDTTNKDHLPNRRILGEIIFEPMMTGILVTARDKQHRTLWGYVASKETVQQVHCLVAIYETLQDLLMEDLEQRDLFFYDDVKMPIRRAEEAFDRIEQTIKWLRDSLKVNKVSDATRERAKNIYRIISDANRQISLLAKHIPGIKPQANDDP